MKADLFKKYSLALALLMISAIVMSCQPSNVDGSVEKASALNGIGLAQEAVEAPVKAISDTDYTVASGDTLSGIAKKFSLRSDTMITYNDIKRSRSLQIGTILKIPNQDGLVYVVKEKDTVDSVAEKFEVQTADILTANRMKDASITVGAKIFLPGARLEDTKLREINGDLFRWPVNGYITSRYGYRKDPFTGERSFHNAIDLGAPEGTPARAAMAGTISSTGFSSGSGNYVMISHHAGYSTIYAHLKAIWVEEGQYVAQGEAIGSVGNTGYSTGTHLHFGVFQWGRSINPLYVLH